MWHAHLARVFTGGTPVPLLQTAPLPSLSNGSTRLQFVIRFARMTSEASKQLAPSTTLGARLWWLISGRAAAVVLLLLISVLWKRSTSGNGVINSLTIAPIILTVAALTLIYCAAHLSWRNFLAQARLQFFADVFLVTWLVWATGNVHSPYAALYIVVISVA